MGHGPTCGRRRAFSDTLAGIAPSDVPLFLAGQIAGTLVAAVPCQWLFAEVPQRAWHPRGIHRPLTFVA